MNRSRRIAIISVLLLGAICALGCSHFTVANENNPSCGCGENRKTTTESQSGNPSQTSPRPSQTTRRVVQAAATPTTRRVVQTAASDNVEKPRGMSLEQRRYTRPILPLKAGDRLQDDVLSFVVLENGNIDLASRYRKLEPWDKMADGTYVYRPGKGWRRVTTGGSPSGKVTWFIQHNPPYIVDAREGQVLAHLIWQQRIPSLYLPEEGVTESFEVQSYTDRILLIPDPSLETGRVISFRLLKEEYHAILTWKHILWQDLSEDAIAKGKDDKWYRIQHQPGTAVDQHNRVLQPVKDFNPRKIRPRRWITDDETEYNEALSPIMDIVLFRASPLQLGQ